jgi:hypothetical protein
VVKWEIQTIIQGHEEDPEDPTMDYTNTYVDWSYSVEIAIQGAIACFCYKYHNHFSSTTPYFASFIHEYSIDVVCPNLSFEYQRRVSRPRYCYGVIVPAEFYGLF